MAGVAQLHSACAGGHDPSDPLCPGTGRQGGPSYLSGCVVFLVTECFLQAHLPNRDRAKHQAQLPAVRRNHEGSIDFHGHLHAFPANQLIRKRKRHVEELHLAG